MKIQDRLHGWVVREIKEITDIKATMYILEHEVCGTRMLYVDREDECKTFAISFVTPPTDDTGVFHILEHAVLCGSRKFPLKEPFTDLLQTSPNCYLNAMTYPDKTVYPVSSKSAKDFHNLVDVYMDAVLHPRATRCENIFRQEGWRYEIGEDGRLDYNGVVYSEMKGVFSSPMELLNLNLSRLIFPHGTYSYESGGTPDAITTLTYEDFVAAHAKFYHPSGACIYLDGKIDVDDIFPLLDEYLKEYERCEMSQEIVRGESIIDTPQVASYAVEEGEPTEDKTYIGISYNIDTDNDIFAPDDVALIIDAVADGNTAPLKCAILEGGLCKNVSISTSTPHTWGTLDVVFSEVKDGCEKELLDHFDKCVSDLICRGIADDLLSASIDLTEFKYRECDFGSTPRGIGMLSSVLSFYHAGIDPALALNYSVIYDRQRARLGTNYYTDLLTRVTRGKRAVVILHPSASLAEENEAKLREKLETEKARLGDDGVRRLAAWCEDFREWQSTPDTDEVKAMLPRLTLSDLDEPPKAKPLLLRDIDRAAVIGQDVDTGGITYTDMMFDASDIPLEDIHILGIMARVYSELDTSLHSANEFSKIAKSILGSLSTGYDVVQDDDGARLFLTLKFSSLDKHRERALELVEEYLYKAVFDNPKQISYKLSQLLHTQQIGIVNSGHAYALRRAVARYCRAEVIKEHISGYEAYIRLKEYVNGGEEAISALIEKMKALHAKILTRPRLTTSIVGEAPLDIAEKTVLIARDGKGVGKREEIPTLPKVNEVIPVSAQVAYASLAATIPTKERREDMGGHIVLANIMNNLVLWDRIRVGGGAYGAGFNARLRSGASFYYSYRDPSPVRSLSVYRTATSAIRELLDAEIDLEGFIIGALGTHFMQASTPYLDASDAVRYHLIGYSPDFAAGLWRSILNTDKNELYSICDELDRAYKDATYTVVSPRTMLDGLDGYTLLEL